MGTYHGLAAEPKPLLRMVRGMWQCGIKDQPLYTSVARTPEEAYALWKRCGRYG